MPRVNLTDEEAALIEARRQKNAVKLMRNATLDEAKMVVDQVLSRMQDPSDGRMCNEDGVVWLASTLILAIQSELDKRREKI